MFRGGKGKEGESGDDIFNTSFVAAERLVVGGGVLIEKLKFFFF
jgi:hypothetical protein